MPTIDQLCRDIASLSRKITSKETDLKNCTQDLKMLTIRRASLQTQVTKKNNEICNLERRSNLTPIESGKLARLKSELPSNQQEFCNRESEEKACSQQHTNLIIGIANLKRDLEQLKQELNTQKSSGAINYISRSSFRR